MTRPNLKKGKKGKKRAKKGKKGLKFRYGKLPETKGKKMTDLHETTELSEELKKLPIVRFVDYEFPGVWFIYLKDNRVFHLGDVNTNWGWNDEICDLAGDTLATDAKGIASDFYKWVKGLEA